MLPGDQVASNSVCCESRRVCIDCLHAASSLRVHACALAQERAVVPPRATTNRLHPYVKIILRLIDIRRFQRLFISPVLIAIHADNYAVPIL